MFNLDFFEEIRGDLYIVEKEIEKYVQTPNPLLTETSTHLLFAGGKRIRPAFTLLSGKFHDYSLDKLLPLAVALEMVHMATLVHDDVVDASLTRRGIPTVKAKWGNRISLHTGDYLLSKALSLISQYEDKRIPTFLAQVSVQMCQGEIIQLATAFDINQTIKDYFYKIKRKTAMLIAASCHLGAVAVNAPEKLIKALVKYGHCLGMAFQIIDDILDMIADEAKLGKPVGSDLRQGIITLPAIYALQQQGNSSKLAKLLQSKEKTNTEVKEAILLIKDTGGIEYAFAIARNYVNKAKKQLSKLPPHRCRNSLELMADFIYDRTF
ncbi:MAG: polyprenyl synthetase family protein [Bacillota bacterium]